MMLGQPEGTLNTARLFMVFVCFVGFFFFPHDFEMCYFISEEQTGKGGK